jgi:hypothetical protein
MYVIIYLLAAKNLAYKLKIVIITFLKKYKWNKAYA